MRHFPEKSDISSSDPRSMFSDIDDMISVNPECDDGKVSMKIFYPYVSQATSRLSLL